MNPGAPGLDFETWKTANLNTLNYATKDLVPRCERQQGDVPGLLDRACKTALVRGADAGKTPRHNLAALRHEALQQTDIAVWDSVNLLSAELADLLAAEKLSASAGSALGPCAGSALGPSAAGAGRGTRAWAGFRCLRCARVGRSSRIFF
jgi:hypothetical protein